MIRQQQPAMPAQE